MPTTSPLFLFVEILSATNPATIMNPDPEASLVAIALENFLGAAAVMLRQRYQEAVLSLVSIAEADIADALDPHLVEFHVQLAVIAAIVVSLFDADIPANLPAALLPFRQLADEQCVHRALLRQMNYLGDVGEHCRTLNTMWPRNSFICDCTTRKSHVALTYAFAASLKKKPTTARCRCYQVPFSVICPHSARRTFQNRLEITLASFSLDGDMRPLCRYSQTSSSGI